MVVPIANLSAVVAGTVHAAKALATEILPAAVTRDAVLEAARASVAWFLRHLWAWLVAARAVAVENLPVAAAAAKIAAGSAAEASEPWLEMAAKLLRELYGGLLAAGAMAVEKLPDAAAAAKNASGAWFLRHLWAWLVAARAVAVENLPVAAAAAKSAVGSAAEASVPWLEMAAKLLRELYGWLVAAGAMAVEKLPDAAAAAKNAAGFTVEALQPWLEMSLKLLHDLYGRLCALSALSVENLPDAAASMARGGGAGSTAEASSPSLRTAACSLNDHGVAVYALLVLALTALTFLCGAVWALTCRTMKGPGLGGARVPRAMFEANPRRYYATVRVARKARRGASGVQWKLLMAAPMVACAAYLVAKTLY